VKPINLVTGLIDAIRERNPQLDPAGIEDVVLGVVSPIGDQGSDIARTAAVAAGFPTRPPASSSTGSARAGWRP
jgi:acetyl-CoA C-acetyltransferase